MPELSPFSQNLSMTRILCGSFEKLKKLQPEKQRSNHFVGNGTPYSPRVPSGDFADSLAVFAVPEPIGLKSYIRVSGVSKSLRTSP
jgi:hypothetical protein